VLYFVNDMANEKNFVSVVRWNISLCDERWNICNATHKGNIQSNTKCP